MLFGFLERNKYKKWRTYDNYINYPKYAKTPLPTAKTITASFTQMNAKGYLKQYEDSMRLVETTTKPDVFFYRYDYAIKRLIGLIYMQKYIRVKSQDHHSLEETVEDLIDNKEQNTKAMIDRALAELKNKVSGLKTPKSRLTNITKFVDSFKGFVEVSPANFTYLVTQTENIKKQIGVI